MHDVYWHVFWTKLLAKRQISGGLKWFNPFKSVAARINKIRKDS